MNERIRLLAEQADIHFHKGGTLDAGPNGIARFVLYSDMEKFAELIVRECVSVGRTAFLNDHSTVPVFPAEKIKEHFGVEE